MEKDKHIELIKCECGYNNQPFNVKRFGTCTRCGKVLDDKEKFKHDMYSKLNLWRYEKGRAGR